MLKYVLAIGFLVLGTSTVAHAVTRCDGTESLTSDCSTTDSTEDFWKEWNKRSSRGPGPGGPGYPRPGRGGQPDYGRGHGRSTFVSCQAKDARGYKFTATAVFGRKSSAQRQALNACYSNSSRPRTCRPVGCFSANF